jgi:hypothetical protein
LSFAAIYARTSDLNICGAFADVRNDPTRNEQERYGGRNRERLRVHFQILPPNGFASLRRGTQAEDLNSWAG